MEGSEGRLGRFWRLCWQLTPGQKQWLCGTGGVALARTMGLFLATGVGSAMAVLARDAMLNDPDAALYWRVAEGMGIIALGGFVHLGQGWASLVLMVLAPVDRVIGYLTAYRRGDAYFVDHPAYWLFIGLSAGAIWIRVFWVAYQAERRQAATDGAA